MVDGNYEKTKKKYNKYRKIHIQTIQLFPQLFLGKHWGARASRALVEPSDNVESDS